MHVSLTLVPTGMEPSGLSETSINLIIPHSKVFAPQSLFTHRVETEKLVLSLI